MPAVLPEKKPLPVIIAGNGSFVYPFLSAVLFGNYQLPHSGFTGCRVCSFSAAMFGARRNARRFSFRPSSSLVSDDLLARRLSPGIFMAPGEPPASRLTRTRSACCDKPAAPERTPDIRPPPAFQSAVPAVRPHSCTARSSGLRGGVRDRSILHYPKG